VNSGGSFGASPLQQHIGLGAGAQRVDVEITWPVSRMTQRFTNVPRTRSSASAKARIAYAQVKRASWLMAAVLVGVVLVAAPHAQDKRYSGARHGAARSIAATRTFTVSHDAIEGLMERDDHALSRSATRAKLAPLAPGTLVDFTLDRRRKAGYAADIRVRTYQTASRIRSRRGGSRCSRRRRSRRCLRWPAGSRCPTSH
jgi:hypothetical protein